MCTTGTKSPAKSKPHDVIRLLAEKFPQTFAVSPIKRRPLKVGIFDDLCAALDGVVDEKRLKLAVKVYVSNPVYRRFLKIGALRFDLTGKPCGAVTEAETQMPPRLNSSPKPKATRPPPKPKAAKPPPEPKAPKAPEPKLRLSDELAQVIVANSAGVEDQHRYFALVRQILGDGPVNRPAVIAAIKAARQQVARQR